MHLCCCCCPAHNSRLRGQFRTAGGHLNARNRNTIILMLLWLFASLLSTNCHHPPFPLRPWPLVRRVLGAIETFNDDTVLDEWRRCALICTPRCTIYRSLYVSFSLSNFKLNLYPPSSCIYVCMCINVLVGWLYD